MDAVELAVATSTLNDQQIEATTYEILINGQLYTGTFVDTINNEFDNNKKATIK